MDTLAAIILTARDPQDGDLPHWHSRRPGCLHKLAGLPLVVYSLRLALSQQCSPIVVVVDSSAADQVEEVLSIHAKEAGSSVQVVGIQRNWSSGECLALNAGLEALPAHSRSALVLCAEYPLLQSNTLADIRQGCSTRLYSLVDSDLKGRALPLLCGPVTLLGEWVKALMAGSTARANDLVDKWACRRPEGLFWVGSRRDLGEAEKLLRQRLVNEHQEEGVTFRDPDNTWVGPDVTFGTDVEVGVGVQLVGRTHLADGVVVEGPTVIKDSVVGANSRIAAFSHLDTATVGEDAGVGPYGRLRQHASIGRRTYVGNFVELKNASLHEGAQACHLAYLGDAEVGASTNIGAGTITCNFDGHSKHRTCVGKNVFVGSNSTLVAPVTLGEGAFVAAGSVITDHVPGSALAFGRARQTTKEGYAQQLKDRMAQRQTAQ